MNEFHEEHAKMDVRLYLNNALAYLNQTWCVITTMIWSYLHSFGKAPPSGQEFWKWIFLIITWTIWPKITRLVILLSWRHTKLNDTQYSHVSYFEFYRKMLFFYECIGVLLQNSVCVIGTMPWRYSESFGPL